jgi:hypothetical protein
VAKTRGDLVNRALNMLGAVGSGQTASAEDVTLVDGLLNPTLAELRGRKVIVVGNPGVPGNMTSGGFDDAFYLPLAAALAKAAAPDFGLAGGALADLYSMAVDGENRLRAMQDSDIDIDEPIPFRAY